MRFRTLHFYTITWKNHKNGSHTNKNSTWYRSCHTTVWGEYYLCHILITRICGGSHSYVRYYYLSLLKQAVFIIVPIISPNTVLHLKGQFALVNVVWNEGYILQPEEFLADYEAIYHIRTLLNRNLKEERRKNKRFAICENSYIYILYNII